MENKKVDLSCFKNYKERSTTGRTSMDDYYSRRYVHYLQDYSPEEIDQIINSSSLCSQMKLSRNYFEKNNLYKQIILYYATILYYNGLLIPNPTFGKQLSTPYIEKRFRIALEYLNKLDLVNVFTRISIHVLIYGSYYGLIQTLDKENFIIFDLPIGYARSRLTDIYGNHIIDFDTTYFDDINDLGVREETLQAYPPYISNHYRMYKANEVSSPWVRVPVECGVCFSFFDDERPLFLNIIPSTIQYEDAVDTEQERELEEIRKIIVQKIPHLNDGQLLFEPDEALEMHEGAVNMMKGNKNLSVLTTYADVDSIISKTSADNASSTLEKMLQNVYANAGVSAQIFAPTGSQALPYSIKNDISVMMILGNKYAKFISTVINTLFSNNNIYFTYLMLPVGEFNKSDFVTDALKLAQSGYSFLMPAVAMGLNQLELVNLKDLENDVLDLKDRLIPLSTSYTESNDGPGAPEKPLEQKSTKTIQNIESIDRQGETQNE